MKNKFTGLLLLVILISACRQSVQFTDNTSAKLSFSADTVHFDTVFTTVGSITKSFRFYNPNSQAIRTSINLAKGSASFYNINVDGMPATSVNEFELMAGDSAYVFVEVIIDPLNSNTPLVVSDSVVFITNGNVQDVKLLAYGQDVHLLVDSTINTQTWVNDKPYLVTNYVFVETGNVLTINPGVKIYFNSNSSLWVNGTLQVLGTAAEPVIFEGARLDEWYKDAPGQWGRTIKTDSVNSYLTAGIHFFQGSGNNIIDYAIIKNGIKGIQADSVATQNKPTLTISNTQIKNMAYAGIIAQSANLDVYNTVVSSCGYYAVALLYGGNYRFYHNTIANYFPYHYGARKTESVIFNNYFEVKDKNTELTTVYSFPFQAVFGNCIIDGDQKNEFVYDATNHNNVSFGFLFDHCLMRLDNDFVTTDTNIYKNVIRSNENNFAKFVDYVAGNYKLDTLSPVKDAGSKIFSGFIPVDIENIDRNNDIAPDIGAYERVE